MILIDPNETVRLCVMYQENGTYISELTDLSVVAFDVSGTLIIDNEPLIEDEDLKEYYYDWDVTGIPLESIIRVYFKKGTDFLYSEDYRVDVYEDMDGTAV